MFSVVAFSQAKFFVMPHLKTNLSTIDFMDNNDAKNAFNFNIGVTGGIRLAGSVSHFMGLQLARNGYGYVEQIDDDSDVSVSFGATFVGAQYFYRTNSGFAIGGNAGCNFWDKNFLYDGDKYKSRLSKTFAAELQAGYSWTHVALLGEVNYNNGFGFGACLCFPIFSAQ